MATANIGGLNIVYEIVGSTGPVIALMPGARRGSDEMKPLAEKMAAKGVRVLLHDRRNTGGSDMLLDSSDTEEITWACTNPAPTSTTLLQQSRSQSDRHMSHG